MTIVSFQYRLGQDLFGTSIDVETEQWNDYSPAERLEYLENAALDEIRDDIVIEEDSIIEEQDEPD